MLNITTPMVCERECHCAKSHGETRLVVITGGPGAGKTAVLEIVRKELCAHVVILPEAASLVFGGGFWRLESLSAIKAAQRAILHIQQEIERVAVGEQKWAMALCDRGVLDGLAYWPGHTDDFWAEAKTTLEAEYARYYSVIHLRTPSEDLGYNHVNPLRTETAAQAALLDEKIHTIWSSHPRYRMIESTPDFLVKAQKAISYIIEDMPACCAQALQIAPG